MYVARVLLSKFLTALKIEIKSLLKCNVINKLVTIIIMIMIIIIMRNNNNDNA